MDNLFRKISIGLAFIGLLDSLYLTGVKFTGQYALCGPVGDCESVNSSIYSEVYGIPIALLGALAYLGILISLFAEGKNVLGRDTLRLMVFGISLVGVIFSIYLTYIEIAVLKAICPYCVLSAIILVILLVLSTLRVAHGVSLPREEYPI